MRHLYLVCYDITDDARRTRVFKLLRGFGDHLQFSVFECQMNRAELVRCQYAVREAIHQTEDQVLFVNLGPADGRGAEVVDAIGRPYTVTDAPCLIVDGEQPATGRRRGGRRGRD